MVGIPLLIDCYQIPRKNMADCQHLDVDADSLPGITGLREGVDRGFWSAR